LHSCRYNRSGPKASTKTHSPHAFDFLLNRSVHLRALLSSPTRRSSDLHLSTPLIRLFLLVLILLLMPTLNFLPVWFGIKSNISKIGRVVQQECRDRDRMPSSA